MQLTLTSLPYSYQSETEIKKKTKKAHDRFMGICLIESPEIKL